MQFRKTLLGLIVVGASGMAHAAGITIDFAALANTVPGANSNYAVNSATTGESAYSTLHIVLNPATNFFVDITGTAGNPAAFAYLDAGFGGLGVCKTLGAGATTGGKPGNTANLCSDSTDDNVTSTEKLTFKFNKNVKNLQFWFNDNHDGGFNATSKVNINGTLFHPPTLATNPTGSGAAGDPSTVVGNFTAAANSSFFVKYAPPTGNATQQANQAPHNQFYVSGFAVEQAPEPAALSVLGLALVGVGLRRRAV